MELPDAEFQCLATGEGLSVETYGEMLTGYENEYVSVRNESTGNTLGCRYRGGYLRALTSPEHLRVRIAPQNEGQFFAIHALTRSVKESPMTILEGKAGTAKTFLSLACGLSGIGHGYQHIIYTRPNQLSDAEHGFLSGDLMEKLRPLIMPAIDNLEKLLPLWNEAGGYMLQHVEDLFQREIVRPLSMAYMRGRSLDNAFLIVDEAQNCTRGQIYDIVTRAGNGTKVVLCGDSTQVDNPVLDRYTNGLAFAIDRMKDSRLCSQVTFTGEMECVRRAIAKEATKLLR